MEFKYNNLEMPLKALIEDTSMGRPHVVLLGAGASLAAFPKGDKNGKKLPLMCNIIETIGLDSEFDKYNINYKDKNFENIYSDLHYNSEYKALVKLIEERIRDYFSSLKMPSNPTIYDHLVLSLREKDLIATFNWDPFLYYACWRNHEKAKLPQIAYLHGNVAIGYCPKDKQTGLINTECPICSEQYIASKLLFPIKEKNYTKDPFIKAEWDKLRLYLSHAYLFTIYGYSAPDSDIEAMELMKYAWGSPFDRNLEDIEIIDVKPEASLRNTWQAFIHSHHYSTTNDFYESSIGLFPRRTCEATWNYTMPKKPAFYPHNPIPNDLPFNKLWEWYSILIESEK